MLLGGRFPDFRRVCGATRLPTRGAFPLSASEQWPVAAFVPVTVAGAAPAFHRLPSPANKRLRLSQKEKSLSSSGSARGDRRGKHSHEKPDPTRSLLI
jgi:hypothetical protein